MKQKNYNGGLSIVIPTYNREGQLKRAISYLKKHNVNLLHEIVIIDNDSDYDVEGMLNEFEINNLRLVKNSFNVRMSTNIMNPFFYCTSKWMWILSDDDVVYDDSVLQVLKDIDNHSDVSMLKYSTAGTGYVGEERDELVSNLEGFIDYYHNDKQIRKGNLVFVSNAVYNLEQLHTFLGRGYEFSYTYIPYLIPVLFSLNSGGKVQFKKEKVVEYINPGDGFWSFKTVGLGLSTMSHLPLELKKIYREKLLEIFMPINYDRLFLFLVEKKIKDSSFVFSTIYYNSYRHYLSIFSKLKFKLLAFLLRLPQLSAFCVRLLKKIKNANKQK